jgi:hypothetical protein
VTVYHPATKETVEFQKILDQGSDSAQSKIKSVEELEKIIIETIAALTNASGTDNIWVSDLKKQFQAKYNITADASVKVFHPDLSLIKFLRSRATLFSLTLVGKEYRVAIAST